VGLPTSIDLDDLGPQPAIESLLHAARRNLRMDAAFLAEVVDDAHIMQATSGPSAETFTIVPGGSRPLIETYCQHVMAARAPWVIRDTSQEPLVATMPATTEADVGAYIGVPVLYPDGRPFGTLCCISHDTSPELGSDQVAVLQALAEVLGFHVRQLEQRREAITGLRGELDELAHQTAQIDLDEAVFRHLVDTSSRPTLLLDVRALRIRYANGAAAALADTTPAAMQDTQPWLHHPIWEQRTLTAMLEQLRTGAQDQVRYGVEPIEGAPALDVHARRVDAPQGAGAIVWTAHDVNVHHEAGLELRDSLGRESAALDRERTALERERAASDELRRLDETRAAFMTAVSHELRTPLTTVKGVAEVLRTGRVPLDEADALLDRLARNADRLDRLLTDLLDLRRYELGVMGVRRERCRLDAIVRDAVEQLDDDEHPITLELEHVEAMIGPVKFERIVANLVRNATIHTPPGTPITVTLRAADGRCNLRVADRGPGVPLDQRGRIFEPFQQGGTAPAHRPGTGIGLSLVAAFVALHEGEIRVDDVPGGGAVFDVSIPLS
jgi:signal transduction histidine kinase